MQVSSRNSPVRPLAVLAARWPTPRGALMRVGVAVLVSLVTGLLYSPGLSTRIPRYQAGQFTTASIRAPFDFSVVDDAATDRRRVEARRAVAPVALLDPRVPVAVKARADAAFGAVSALYDQADAMRAVPAPELARLSARRQAALRQTRVLEADRVLREKLAEAIPGFEQALGVTLTSEQRAVLEREQFARSLTQAINRLLDDLYTRPVTDDLAPLEGAVVGDSPTMDGPGRLSIKDGVTSAERSVGGLASIQSRAQAIATLPGRAALILPDLAPDVRATLAAIAQAIVRPDLFFDAAITEARRAAAASAVNPVSLIFQRNQLIIGEGQEVVHQTVLALDYLRTRGRPQAYVARLLGSSVLLCLLVLLAFHLADRTGTRERVRDRDFMYLASSLVGVAVAFWTWRVAVDGIVARVPSIPPTALVLAFPLAAIAMLTCFMLSFRLMVAQLVPAAVIIGMLGGSSVLLVAHTLITGFAGAYWITGCTRRGCLVRAGLVVGVAGAVGAACIVLLDGTGGLESSSILVVVGGLVGGVLAGPAVVAMGPVVEWVFGYTSNIRLLEMVSYEHPLLRRFMKETPGTFQHSLGISILGDAAARAIGADALLVRVGALYHDVGKIGSPECFVENQAGVNPHDTLAPAESARIVRDHVAAGVDLLREYKVAARIEDFVREHHGTDEIRYFRALAEERGETIDPDAYRYPGPRPRSPETGILMIADQVEATSRTMARASEAEYREMVHRTVERIRAAGQLDDCPLTLRDLALIEDSLVQILGGMHHRRLTYPGQPPTAGEAARPAAVVS